MTNNDERRLTRIFVVGCARSGTTLLHAMLSSHPDVLGFPETFFFVHASRTSGVWRVLPDALRHTRHAREALLEALERLDALNFTAFVPSFGITYNSYARGFIRLLDELASEREKRIWIEKTPGHIRHIDSINRLLPTAMFVHMLRDGRDVVASLEHLRRHSLSSGIKLGWPLEKSIRRWNEAIRISQRHARDPRHVVIRYDELVRDSRDVLRTLCGRLGLPFEVSMLDYSQAAGQVLGRDARNAWRTDVLGPLRNTHLIKYRELFTRSEQKSIEDALTCGGDVSRAFRFAVDSPQCVLT